MDRGELWKKLSQRPKNVRFDELDELLRRSEWQLNHVRGSHHIYRSPEGKHLSIPRRSSTMNVAYVRIVLEATKEPDDDERRA